MSRFEDPVIITNSISGTVANRDQCPAIPYTPEEYAAEARRVVDEGGSMIHIHARKTDGTPSYDIEDFQAITEAILAEVDDVVINYSTGAIGIPIEKRLEYLRALKPDVAALNMGSMNYAKYSRRRNNWGVIGISREQWMLVAAALTLGGNVRVGLEDNFYLPNGEMARSNGDLIAEARRMVEMVGRRPATVAEARELLGTPKRAAVAQP